MNCLNMIDLGLFFEKSLSLVFGRIIDTFYLKYCSVLS